MIVGDAQWDMEQAVKGPLGGKTLGIVRYSCIGSQLSVLTESFGTRSLFHNVINIMPLGQACQVESLQALLV